ncbi:dystonin isoform X11 [Narcine bancroftii]|uniref:dystonin isoform X11 n=1 Tax=Narcine bancroftii TaxID=1343680 RepID=UPI003831A7A9
MGNTCGCVRAQKEECAVDPAKAPLSSSPHPRSKFYLKRRKEQLLFAQELVQRSDAIECQETEAGVPSAGVTTNQVSSRKLLAYSMSQGNGRARDDSRATVGEQSSLMVCHCVRTGIMAEAAPHSNLHSWAFCHPKGGVQSDRVSWECVADSTNPSQVKKLSTREPRSKLTGIQDNQHSPPLEDMKVISLGAVARVEPISSGESKLSTWPSRSPVDIFHGTFNSTASAGQLLVEPHHKSTISRQQERVFPGNSSTSTPARSLRTPLMRVAGKLGTCQDSDGNGVKSLLDEISDIHVTGESEDMSAKEKLLLWSQQAIEGYAGIRCENFTSCWRDGRVFNAIIHKYRPDLVDMSQVAIQSNVNNLEQAFGVAEKLGVTRLLDPEDVNVASPDEKSVITYVSSLYDVFPKIPEDGEGINANDVEVKWIEYQNMVNYLIQWIKHHVTVMSDRSYSNNPAELKALYNQYMQFKDTEIPPKEKDKAKIKQLYKLLEVWIEFGRIKLPPGYHPNDVEKEWGKLIIAMLEREKSLRPEVERLEILQQIASRLHNDSVACEDKLILAQNSLQLDAKRLESGLQFQNETEVAGYLLEAENLTRQQIIDIQILIDGKYYQADQLIQRVAKLRDELMMLKSEYSSVYSKGRSSSTNQTQLMMAGLTQSLNQSFSSDFSQSLTPSLTSTLSRTSSMTHGTTPVLTPSLPATLSSGLKPVLAHGFIQGFVPTMDTDALQTVKLLQIRKPLMRSQFVDQSLTEEEVNMNFLQDLLSWVEDMQVQLAHAEWGSDLPSIESHLENHKNVHRAIEDFELSIREARSAEGQMTSPLCESYSEKLRVLQSQYSKLLDTSRDRAAQLDSLHNFVSRATTELIWLNEKEEEEVAYDWSDRNCSMLRKKEYHAELMQELEDKDVLMRSVQDMADKLLLHRHPARATIEAFKAAMQTQWSWILQLCSCVEKHLKENTAYFEFFNDAKESMDYLKNLQEMIKRKYNGDKTSSLVRLEDLVQDSMDEKEQLLQYKSNIASLMSRAKAVVQLKPRNPENPTRISIPIRAICDYKQIEITIYKDDECLLENNSYRAKWKVISPTGNEAMVPSVCFSVPPPNKEAIEMASRIEQLYQNVLTLWHQSHINMKSIVSWHYLMNEISTIRAWNVSSVKTMLPGEHQQVLSSLQVHLKDFLKDSEESEIFSVSDGAQLEREVKFCKQYYEDLLKSAEREEQEESACNLFISEVRTIRLRMENCEKRLICQIRTPLERDDLQESVQRISEQEKLKSELEELVVDLEKVTGKCDQFCSQISSPSALTLRTELSVVLQNLNQVYSLSSIYLDKLKTVNLIVKNTQEAEALVKQYETKLGGEDAVPPDPEAIQSLQSTLKQWRAEVDEKREVFHSLEDELQKGKVVSERMLRAHNERDMDMDWHKEKAVQLAERWESIRSQIDNRLHELEGISTSLHWYRDCHKDLDQWIQEMEATQQRMQERQPEDIRALADELHQQKMLTSEVELQQGKMDECQKYSEEYSFAVKEYELQLLTYKAMVDSQQKSPVKRRRMQSSSDLIVQEFMDLRTRYTALVTLMMQYVKFASDALKRSEEEEKSVEEAKQEHVEKVGELLRWVSEKSKSLATRQCCPPTDKPGGMETSISEQQALHMELTSKKDQIDEAIHMTQMFLAKHSDKISEDDYQRAEKQVESLREAYDKLCEQSSEEIQQSQSMLAEASGEKTYEAIAGVVDLSTGIVYPIFHAVRSGRIDYDTGVILLEAQVIVSGLISPETRHCLTLEEALECQLVDQNIFNQLQLLSKYATYTSSTMSGMSKVHPAVAACAGNVLPEALVIKVLEAELATGGLRVPVTGERLSLEEAFQRKFITARLYFRLEERQRMCLELIDPCTSERVSLMELMQRTIVDEDTNLRLLPVRWQESGMITLKSGREMSAFRAVHEGLIDREVMIRLMGAQLFAGGLIDPQTERRLTVDEALECDLIDHDTASSLLAHQVQTGGIINPKNGCRLTMDEAVQCNLITSSSALLVLESQRVFMGLIWPDSGEIFSTDTSLQQGVVTNELAHKILSNREKIAALYIPESSLVLTPEEARVKGIIDQKTARFLNTIQIPDIMPRKEAFQSSHTGPQASDWTTDLELEPCAVSDTAGTEEADQGQNQAQNEVEVRQRFMIDLMMHSYMDAGSGRRLLLVDSGLNEKVQMVMEASGACDPFKNWQGCFCDQQAEAHEDHLESKGLLGGMGTSKSYSESQESGVEGGEQLHDVAGEHNGNTNSEEWEWIPGLRQLLFSEHGEMPHSPTAGHQGNVVVGTGNLCGGKATESWESAAEYLEAASIQGVSSPDPDLNGSIGLAKGTIDSLGSGLEKRLKECATIPEDDAIPELSQLAWQSSDCAMREGGTTTFPEGGQQVAEMMQRTPFDQHLIEMGFTPLPLDMDFQTEFGEDLKKMLGLPGNQAVQERDQFFCNAEDFKELLGNSSVRGARDRNVEEYEEPLEVEALTNAGGKQDTAVTSIENRKNLVNENMQWLPVELQVLTEGAEFTPLPLESEAGTNEDPVHGSNKITSVPSLEDIADIHEIVEFVGDTCVTCEDTMNVILKIEGDVEFDVDDTSADEADDAMFEDTALEDQVVLEEFVEESKDSSSVEEMNDAVMPSVDHHLIVASKTLRSSPMETETKRIPRLFGTESEKHRDIMIIETLDDIADMEDKMMMEQSVIINDLSPNEKPHHCIATYTNVDTLGNEMNGLLHTDVNSSLHQYIEPTSEDKNSKCWKNKAITSVEGLEDIAETQEIPWCDGGFTEGKEVQVIKPGTEDREELLEDKKNVLSGDFNPDFDKPGQDDQTCYQDFATVEGQGKSQYQDSSESVQKSSQMFELDKVPGSLANPDSAVIGSCLDISSTQQEKSSGWAISLTNAEGSDIGRHLYDLEEEEGAQINSLEAAKNTKWDRCVLIKQLQSEVEAGGIFDPVTGSRYNLEAALARGLLDEEMVVDVLVSQFCDGGIPSEETGENLTLGEAVTRGLLQSQVAIKVLDKLGLMGGFCTSREGEVMELTQVAEGLVNDEQLAKVLLSEKVVSGVIHPETRKVHSINDAVRLGVLDSSTALHLLEGQVASGGIVDLHQAGRLSVDMALKLCLVDEGHADQLIQIERARNGEQVDQVTRLRALSYQFEMHGVLDPQTGQPLSALDMVDRGFVERDAVLHVLRKQVVDGGIIQHKSGLRLSVMNALRHGLISENLAGDLFELEIPRQNVYSSSSGKYLLPREPSDFSVEMKSNLKSNQWLTELSEVESNVGDSLDSLKSQTIFSERRGNSNYSHLDTIPYSDLMKLSSIDIETGQRYMTVKPPDVLLDADGIETMSTLKAADTDQATAWSNHKEDLKEKTLQPAEEAAITVQDLSARNGQHQSSKPLASDASASEENFLSNEVPHICRDSAEGLSLNQDYISSKSSDLQGSRQDEFFMYIRECMSDSLPETEMSESSEKENILANEEKLTDEDGRLDSEIFVGDNGVEELGLNNTKSTTAIQDLIGNKVGNKQVESVVRVPPDTRFGLYEQTLLTEMLTDYYTGAQSIDCDDSSVGPEQKGNLIPSLGNVLRSVHEEPSDTLKNGSRGDLQNPSNTFEINGSKQERKTGEALNNAMAMEAKGVDVCRMKETENKMSNVSRSRTDEREGSDSVSQLSFAESENFSNQDQSEGQGIKDAVENNLGKLLQVSFEVEENASTLLQKEVKLSENSSVQRAAGVSEEAGLNEEANLIGLMEHKTEMEHSDRRPGPNVTLSADVRSSVEKRDLLQDCLTQVFIQQEFRESNDLKDNRFLKVAELLAGLKPEMLSAEVQEMFGALSEDPDPCTSDTQDLISRLTNELSGLFRLHVPDLMEDESFNRKVKETLCKNIPVLLNTEGSLPNVSLETVGEGKDNINQMKANLGSAINDETKDPIILSDCSVDGLESQESIAKEFVSVSAPNAGCLNDNRSCDGVNETGGLRQGRQGEAFAVQSSNVLDKMEFLEDARDKFSLEDTSGRIHISRDEPVGDWKEELQVGRNKSEDVSEMIHSDSFNKIDLQGSNQESNCKLPLGGAWLKFHEDYIGKEIKMDGQNINEGQSNNFPTPFHSFNDQVKLRKDVQEEGMINNATSNAMGPHLAKERDVKSNKQSDHEDTSRDSFGGVHGNPDISEQPEAIQGQVFRGEIPNCLQIDGDNEEKNKTAYAIACAQNAGKQVHEDLSAANKTERLGANGEKSSSQGGSTEVCHGATEDIEIAEGNRQPSDFARQCLQHREKLQAHLVLLQGRKVQLESQQTVGKNLEILQEELCDLKLLDGELEELVTHSLRGVEGLLGTFHVDAGEMFLRILESDYKDLQAVLGDVMELSSSRTKALAHAIETEQLRIRALFQELCATLEQLSCRIRENTATLKTLQAEAASDVDTLQRSIQQHKVLEETFTAIKLQLDGTAFDIQVFISEHALDLPPEENRKLLKLLNGTQTSCRSAMEVISTQMKALNLKLQTRLEQDNQKALEEKQEECSKRLQEITDLLMETENKVITYDRVFSDDLADLRQRQAEHQALQKEIQANAVILTNVVSATEQFLEKIGEKLQPEQKTTMENRVKEAKQKLSALSETVDSNIKNLDKAVTSALKQETEKAAAVKQLKETDNKIQDLLDCLSRMEQETLTEQKGKEKLPQNGNTISVDGLKIMENEDTVNGNLPCILSESLGDEGKELTASEELNQQHEKAKRLHQQVASQQQSYIISTRAAQDFLQKQGPSIPFEQREKMERDLNRLKVQYETVLAQSEGRLKLIETVQDELKTFSTDYSEFEKWLHQSEQQLVELQAGAEDIDTFNDKLKRQKSFSEDVISHKGDLRYITIAGQRVLDAAKSCGKLDLTKDGKPQVDTSATCALVQSQLNVANECYKSLHSKCNLLGKALKDMVAKFEHYQEVSSELLPWLQATEEAAGTQLTEAIAADPKNLQKQLEQAKVLHHQISGHQRVVEKLRKTVDALMGTNGELLLNRKEIQDNLDDVVLRYENLSKSVNERNERLQVTLMRSLSVQDGLDEMLDWMASVEKSLNDNEEVSLNSAAIQEALSKNSALEQNLASRQSSINAIEEKAKRFIATADPSTASALQAKVDELAKRLSSANARHKERAARLEKVRDKVELFEKTFQRTEQFLTKKSQSLSEIDGPGKDINELSQHMQEMKAELLDQSGALNALNKLAEELGGCATGEERTQLLNKVNGLSKKFQGLGEATQKKEEELFSCQLQTDQFKTMVKSFGKWVEGINLRIPAIDSSLSTEILQEHLSNLKIMCDEWAAKASEVQEVNQKGSALCHLINVLISPVLSRPSFKQGPQVVNGGRQGSDICDSKELSAIQQDMADVNNQYEEVGALLKGKEGQLDSMLAQRQGTEKEALLAREWLDSVDKRAACWNALPTENEAIKEQIEQHKVLEGELKQNTDKVEQAKEKLTLLLQENPDSPDAGKWKQMLDYINSKWQKVSQLTSERQQKLEESSSFLTQFETAEVQLRQWLVEKELMMNVLGPLSIDPHMLNNQKQQVQILLKEFETRRPQHEQLKMAAEGILSKPDDSAPISSSVSDQLASVTQKWDRLTGQLVDRSNLIDQAIIKSTQYQTLVEHLLAKLSNLDARLASQPPIDAQPEAVKRQLEVASELRAELKQEEKGVQAARDLCNEISILVGEQYLKAELNRQLDNVVKPFRDLEERAGNRVHQLQSALANSEQFQQMFDDFQVWIGEKCSEQDHRAPISAQLDLLHLLIDEQATFQKSLAQKAGSYEMIVAEGESLLQNMQPGVEKSALQDQLANVRGTWEELFKQVESRQEKLRDCLQKAQKYHECIEHLQPWLLECEAKFSQVQVCSDVAEIESSLASIKALQNDMDKHRRALESLNSAADCLIEASQADVNDVQSEKVSVNQKVDLISEQLQLKKDCLEEMAKCMKEFQSSLRDTKEQLEGARQQLHHHDTLGSQANSSKSLTNLNAQQRVLQALTSQVKKVKHLAQKLTSATSDSSSFLRQADALQEEYESVSQQVRDRCSSLEIKLQGIGQFQNNIREMFSLFADLDDELDSMAPVGRDLDCLRLQKDDIQGFITKLQQLITSIEGAKEESKQMLESLSSPDLFGLKRDLEALSKQCNKLLDRAIIRREEVESTLAHVEEFNKRNKTFGELMAVAEEHEENQGSVGMETEVINQQLESFKVFQKEEIEPLQAVLQEVNRLGQGLIQSVAKNTNIQKLEHDLEEANTRWNTLTKKVAERAAKLQEALLHCGRFQDALESLLSWLTDTEELVANQKPPSAEFKVVKAQIQEQKLLQHLLDDRKATVEMIKREGEKIAESADSADHDRTLNQLQGLSRRWNSLLTKAESRQRQLEALLVVAQQFHDTVEPLMDWISAAEKKVANSEPIGTQTARLQEQITQHKATEDDVISHGKQLHQAISIGQSLKTLSCRDDKDIVQGKLDSAQTRYIEIQDRCSRKAALMQQALSNAWIFGEDEVEVLNWLAEMQDKLDNVAVQDCNPERLQKQHLDHRSLHEDILLRKQQVDQAIQNGLALLKQTTGDEVIIIQERLDSIKARYAEITTTSGKVLKTLEQALQLATKFQSAHEVLSAWLNKVEAELATCASEMLAGEQLAQAQEKQQELRKEMIEHRVSLDTVNEVSSALFELVPWRAREGLDILVSDDNERFKSASETIAQNVDEIDAAIQRSQQYEQRADAEIAWIAETERKLRSLGDIRLEQDQTSAELQVQKI